MEIWKDIIGYEGLYEVSNTGLIRSMDRVCKWKTFYRKRRSQIIKPCKKSKYGHSQVTLCKDGIVTSLAPHRLAAIAFIPNPNNLPWFAIMIMTQLIIISLICIGELMMII